MRKAHKFYQVVAFFPKQKREEKSGYYKRKDNAEEFALEMYTSSVEWYIVSGEIYSEQPPEYEDE